MNLRSFYARRVTPILRRIPLGERFNKALLAFFADLQEHLGSPYSRALNYKIFTDKEIDDLFQGVPPESIALAKRFMMRQFFLPQGSCFIHPGHFYTQEEQQEYKKLRPEYRKTLKKYGFLEQEADVESLYYHHGLRFCPEFVRTNIVGKYFGDIGGRYGDSALVFSEYHPKKIIIYEPIAECRQILMRIFEKNSFPSEKYEICPFALSDKQEVRDGMQCRTLDEISATYSTPFGVLKADIEGMGLNLVKGAEQTIRRDRPLLSLSIYHNADEFAGIYQLLKSWDIDYKFELKQFSPLVPWMELSLFAYPAEWSR